MNNVITCIDMKTLKYNPALKKARLKIYAYS